MTHKKDKEKEEEDKYNQYKEKYVRSQHKEILTKDQINENNKNIITKDSYRNELSNRL